MSALVILLGMVAIFTTAATVALVLSRASREEEIRKEIAAQIHAQAADAALFRPNGDYVRAMNRAARIAEGLVLTQGFATKDSSGNVRMAGDYRRSS